jgi:hypothetical protein
MDDARKVYEAIEQLPIGTTLSPTARQSEVEEGDLRLARSLLSLPTRWLLQSVCRYGVWYMLLKQADIGPKQHNAARWSLRNSAP